jgi:hypothetical protein
MRTAASRRAAGPSTRSAAPSCRRESGTWRALIELTAATSAARAANLGLRATSRLPAGVEFRLELLIDHADEVVQSCRLSRVGRSSVDTRGEVRTPNGRCRTGELAAEAESVLVAGNGGETKSRTPTPEEVAEFGAPAGAPNP